MLLYAVTASLGLAALYALSAVERVTNGTLGITAGAIAFVGLVASFVLPPPLFRYSNADLAPRVMSRVVARAVAASLVVLAVDVGVWLTIARPEISLVEELYVYTLLTVFVFHGFGGAVASHVVYLQETKQYNSNQLVAVLVLVTLILLVLLLYFLAFDFAIAREPVIHARDLIAVTLVLLGYGRAIYLMAHH